MPVSSFSELRGVLEHPQHPPGHATGDTEAAEERSDNVNANSGAQQNNEYGIISAFQLRKYCQCLNGNGRLQ